MNNFSKKGFNKILYIATALFLINNINGDVFASDDQTGLDIINALEQSSQQGETQASESTAATTEAASNGTTTAEVKEGDTTKLPLGELKDQQVSAPQTQAHQASQAPVSQVPAPSESQKTISGESGAGLVTENGVVYEPPKGLTIPNELKNTWVFLTDDVDSLERVPMHEQANNGQMQQPVQNGQQMMPQQVAFEGQPAQGNNGQMPQPVQNGQQMMPQQGAFEGQQPQANNGQMQQPVQNGQQMMPQQGAFEGQQPQGNNGQMQQPVQNGQQMMPQQVAFEGQPAQGNNGQMPQPVQNGQQMMPQQNSQNFEMKQNVPQKSSIIFRCREISNGESKDPNSKILECSVM